MKKLIRLTLKIILIVIIILILSSDTPENSATYRQISVGSGCFKACHLSCCFRAGN